MYFLGVVLSLRFASLTSRGYTALFAFASTKGSTQGAGHLGNPFISSFFIDEKKNEREEEQPWSV